MVDTPTATSEVVRQVDSASRREEANRQLGDMLERVHARQPKGSEEEQLILRETMAVKRARAKKKFPSGRRGRRPKPSRA